MVLGRHPSCQIVLDNAAVSRRHARILESHGSYFLEDLRSRNSTYLNDQPIEGRTELNQDDQIKVCDVEFSFHMSMPPMDDPSGEPGQAAATGRSQRRGDTDETDPDRPTVEVPTQFSAIDDSPQGVVIGSLVESAAAESSIISTLNAGTSSSSLRLSVNPEAKLRAVMGISTAIARELRLDTVLEKILDGLFKIFSQADSGFIMLKSPSDGQLRIRAVRSRSATDDELVRVSRTIVRQAAESREAILSEDAAQDRRFKMSDSLTQLRIRSMMCVPLVSSDDQLLGLIQIDSRNLRQHYTQDDLDLLVAVSTQAAMAVENARLHEEVLAQRDSERDMEFATQVQLGFLPNQRPKLDGYEFYDYYEPALRVGGDYFDYVHLPDGRVAVAMGDVAGKGVSAALLMARLYSAARYHLLTTPDLGSAMSGLNEEISSSGLGHRFVTCCFAVIDPESHEVSIVNAGHLPPLLRDEGGVVKPLFRKQSGMPLGVARDQEFHGMTLELRPGDAVTFFTDGITEAMNEANEIYGRRRLEEFLKNASGSIEQTVRDIVLAVEQFCDGRPQRDDMCLVGFKRLS